MSLTKIPLIAVNLDDDESNAPLGTCREIRNMIPPKSGVGRVGSLENTPGTILQINESELPSGTNKFVGWYEDRSNNRVIIFNYNSNNNDGIYTWNPENGLNELIKTDLGFNSDTFITGIGVVNNLLYYVNGDQVVIDMDDPTSSPNVYSLSMHRMRPSKVQVVSVRSNDSAKPNLITENNYAFSYRYVFKSGEKSKVANDSPTSYGDLIPVYTSTKNRIQVTTYIDTSIVSILDRTQLLFKKNGDSRWFVWEDVKYSGSTITKYFYDSQSSYPVADEEFNNSMPISSNQLAIIDNRAVMTSDIDSYSMDSSMAGLSLSIENETIKLLEPPYFKERGRYSFALGYFDKYGKLGQLDRGTLATTTIPSNTAPTSDPLMQTLPWYKVKATLTGKPPTWAHSYGVFRTKELSYSKYAQFPVRVHFFLGRKGNANVDALLGSTGYYAVGDYVFIERIRETNTNKNYKVWLQMPEEVPISVEIGDSVRVITNISEDEEKISRITGNWIELDGEFGIDDWGDLISTYPNLFLNSGHSDGDIGWIQLLVEVFRIKNESTDIHQLITKTGYSTSPSEGIFTINNPGESNRAFSQTTIRCFGDTFKIKKSPDAGDDGYTFHFYKLDIVQGAAINENEMNGGTSDAKVETPSLLGVATTPEVQTIDADSGLLFGQVVWPVTTNSSKRFVFDYTRITECLGASSVVIKGIELLSKPKTLKYSNTYVQDSNYNGLSDFESLNTFPIPVEASDIKRLVVAGNVLLCICERDTYSLYINETMVTYVDGSQDLVTSDKFISKERKLREGAGTIHPESVVEHKGKVLWFDAHNGDVVRYDLNGPTLIGSKYKWKTFFKERSKLYTKGTRVVGGYDPFLDIYYLTFLGDTPETVAFLDRDGEERWIGNFDFTPEGYAKLNNSLYSFTGGNMYKHNASTAFNQFYGVDYPSIVKVLHNDVYSKDKLYRSIALETNSPWSLESVANENDQDTQLSESDFIRIDGAYLANILRDKNTNPALLSGSQSALRSGKEISSKTLTMELKNMSTSKVKIDYVNVEFKDKDGQGNL